jgi:chromosome segregation ATPase
MMPFGFEAEEWLLRLQEVLTRIRAAIDERRRTLRDLRQTLGDVHSTLREIEGHLSADGLYDLVQQMERLQSDLQKMEPFLSPGMLNDLRLRLKRSQDELSQAAERIAEARQGFRALREALRQQVEEQSALPDLANALKQREDMLTVLIRSLSHLQESRSAPDADTTVRALADLLQGSLRLAALIFDPRQLQGMGVGPQGRPALILDLWRKRWGDWLRELARYIREVSRQAEQIAALEGGTQAEAFRAALQDFQDACRRAAGPGSTGLPPFLKPAPPFPPTSEPRTPEGGSP